MKNKQTIIGLVTSVVLVFIFSTLVVEKRLFDTRAAFEVAVLEQEAKVMGIAKNIGAGQSGEFMQSEGLITACPTTKSQEYDELLSSLDTGLSTQQLEILQNHFNECGSIPAVSRAFMVYLLEQGVETLDILSSQQALLGESSIDKDTLNSWHELVSKEKDIKTQFYALVELQGKIIDTLQAGAQGEIPGIQSEVQAIQQKYATAITEASQLRRTLVTP